MEFLIFKNRPRIESADETSDCNIFTGIVPARIYRVRDIGYCVDATFPSKSSEEIYKMAKDDPENVSQ